MVITRDTSTGDPVSSTITQPSAVKIAPCANVPKKVMTKRRLNAGVPNADRAGMRLVSDTRLNQSTYNRANAFDQRATQFNELSIVVIGRP